MKRFVILTGMGCLALTGLRGWVAPALAAPNLIETVNLLPEKYRPEAIKQLAIAEDNQDELLQAIEKAPADQRAALGFLIANMPEKDLRKLDQKFLLENVEYAYESRAAVPWGKDLPEELFFQYVLPYASVNERRDNWRKDFYEKFLPVAKECRTPGEAVGELNKAVFTKLNVQYHPTKRRFPHQSPYESSEIGYASCTGLSIMLIDACRASCIPARAVGTPEWVGTEGNHTWAEVWDRQWHFVGACEPGPLDQTWFIGNASKADRTKPEHMIYASSYERTNLVFPLIWDVAAHDVMAHDVTPFYTARSKVHVAIADRPDGQPQEAAVTIRYAGQIVAHDSGKSAYDFDLAGGEKYQIELSAKGAAEPVGREITLSADKEQQLSLPIDPGK